MTDKEKKIHDVYYDTKRGLMQDAKKLYYAVNDKSISLRDVQNWLAKQETYQIMRY